jgi:hypothetical protein
VSSWVGTIRRHARFLCSNGGYYDTCRLCYHARVRLPYRYLRLFRLLNPFWCVQLISALSKEPELTGRQRSCYPDPTHPPRCRSRPLHVPLGSVLRQIPPTAIPRVHADMVVLATCDWVHVGLYSRMQDGRTVHFHEYRSCCLVGSLGDSGCQEGTYYGELQLSRVEHN